MSTRCNIEIYDQNQTEPGAILYHHSDGYPDFMLKKLNKFLKESYNVLQRAGYAYWWDSERVASVMIMLSIEDYEVPMLPFSTKRTDYDFNQFSKPYRPEKGIPVFQPCVSLHGDIAYVYKVRLLSEGQFNIEVVNVHGI